MEALNLNIQSQQRNLFDMLQSSGHHNVNNGQFLGSGSSSTTIEFMLRSFDHHNNQEEIDHPLPTSAFIFNHHSAPMLINGTVDQNVSTATTTSTPSSSIISQESALSTSLSMSTNSTTSLRNMSSTTLELDPNIILQNYVNDNPTDFRPTAAAPAAEESSSSSSGGGGGKGRRPYNCDICDASYKTRTHLRRHMMIHLSSRPYPCPVAGCGKGFNRKEHLSKHAEAVHSSVKFICPVCRKQISRKDHLARHVKNMHPTSYAAFLNQEGFLADNATFLHKGSSSPKSNKSTKRPKGTSSLAKKPILLTTQQPIRVPVMSLPPPPPGNGIPRDKSQIKEDLTALAAETAAQSPGKDAEVILDNETFQHIQQFGYVGAIPANIVISGQITPVTVTLSASSGNSSNATPPPPKSSKANQPPPQQGNPNQNGLQGLTNLSMTLGGQIKQAPFAQCSDSSKKNAAAVVNPTLHCSECSLNFSTEKDLSAHLRSHKAQNFRCTECPRAYTRREKLTEHVRCFHQGEKFRCEHCGKELSRKDHVLRHVRSIHPELMRFSGMNPGDLPENLVLGQDETGRLSFPPQQQPSTTSTTSSPNKSSTTSTSSVNEMNSLLRSVCQYCLKVFGTSYHLSRHIESCHNGDIRPYACPSPSCTKQFKRKDHLTKHIKSHCPTLKESASNSSGSGTRMTRKSESNNHQSQNHATAKSKSISGAKQDRKKSKLQASKSLNEYHRKKLEDSAQNETQNLQPPVPPPEEEPTDFNLAMINSFISSNDVVLDDEHGGGGLSSLMLTQDLNTTSAISPSANNDHQETSSVHHNGLRSIQFSNY